MARTISEIKKSITNEYLAQKEVQIKYGIAPGTKWEDAFSKVSIENIIFYVVASALYVVERLLDAHIDKVNAMLDERMPHTLRWYRDKTLAFMIGTPLVEDSDIYNTSGMTEADIEKAKVVKFASVTEDSNLSAINIKVATVNDGGRQPLTPDQCLKLETYLNRIKDAGVAINVINKEPSEISVELDVTYDGLLDKNNEKEAIETAVKNYVENLPFNGEYTNSGLIDAVQSVSGVIDAYVTSATETTEGGTASISARKTPEAGYYRCGITTISMTAR
ncbi:MAG: hypothetical protein IJ341_01260 [Bacteroidales bacterium]|nr:hypothetical protein [Bacteroidales bacterium]